MAFGPPRKTHLQRIVSKFEIGPTRESCWLWMGHLNKGYGQFSRGGHGSSGSAHRAMYALFRGPIPRGMCVCHACDNPRCVNPAHLFLGTQADNHRDMMSKGRGIFPGAPGSKNAKARLNENQVREIRSRLAAGESQPALSVRFNVSTQTISGINTGVNWRHILAMLLVSALIFGCNAPAVAESAQIEVWHAQGEMGWANSQREADTNSNGVGVKFNPFAGAFTEPRAPVWGDLHYPREWPDPETPPPSTTPITVNVPPAPPTEKPKDVGDNTTLIATTILGVIATALGIWQRQHVVAGVKAIRNKVTGNKPAEGE